MSDAQVPPKTTDELRGEVLRRYDELSKRLQQIARHMLDEPSDFALETLAVIASRCGVQPSTIVRFAKTFGFEGASQMQRLFRDGLLSGATALGYSERVRQLGTVSPGEESDAAGQLLTEFASGNILAIQNLLQLVNEADIEAAVEHIVAAQTVHVAGFRRSFPISSYLAYSLLQAGKRTVFVDGAGGLALQQVQTMDDKDVLIAVSYQPYAEETVAVVESARSRGSKVIAISDTLVSPIAKAADVILQVRESEVRGFRSLAASMCLAQALVINYAFQVAREE